MGNKVKRKKIHFGNNQNYKKLTYNETEKEKGRQLESERKEGRKLRLGNAILIKKRKKFRKQG
jgi:hypothetical protein